MKNQVFGAIYSAALPGFQNKGKGLTKVPKIKCVIIISGDEDPSRGDAVRLLESFVYPVVIHHSESDVILRIGKHFCGAILKRQIFDKWPTQVVDKLDLVFVDAPFPSQGKSDVDGIFDPPYYEWYQFNKELKKYENFDKCLAYIQECMIKHGPFDGLLGFSQGALLSGALPGLQDKGMGLTKVPKIKYVIIIGGAKLQMKSLAEKAYSSPITCPSVHFLGEHDFLKPSGMELLESYVDPVVIHHPKGHTIPRFDEKGLESMLSFIEKVQAEINK